jgi:hypothetical protein
VYLRICFDAAPIQVARITRSGCAKGDFDSSGFVFDPRGWKYHVEGASWLKFGNEDLTGGEITVLSPMMLVTLGGAKVGILGIRGCNAAEFGLRVNNLVVSSQKTVVLKLN